MGYSRCGQDKYGPHSSYIVVVRSKSLIRNQEECTNRTPFGTSTLVKRHVISFKIA